MLFQVMFVFEGLGTFSTLELAVPSCSDRSCRLGIMTLKQQDHTLIIDRPETFDSPPQ